LEDWLLPVVYCNQAVNLNLREFTPEEEEKFFESLGSQYRFTQPEYGFVGRDLEILKIEKALLRHNILLLQGMGGTGKTTLLNYLREWWQTTHFAKMCSISAMTKRRGR
jgi:putative ribosome biogenesis GTPase RsgA